MIFFSSLLVIASFLRNVVERVEGLNFRPPFCVGFRSSIRELHREMKLIYEYGKKTNPQPIRKVSVDQ